MNLDFHRTVTVFIFRSWFDLLDVVLAFLIFILNDLQITSKKLIQGNEYHPLRKTFEKTKKEEI